MSDHSELLDDQTTSSFSFSDSSGSHGSRSTVSSPEPSAVPFLPVGTAPIRPYYHIRCRVARLRLRLYRLLDHPQNVVDVVYHLGILSLIMASVISGTIPDSNRSPTQEKIADAFPTIQKIIVIVLSIEWWVRLWAVTAIARYRGKKGIRNYFRRLSTVVDVVVFVASALLLLDVSAVSIGKKEIVRLLQMARLLYLDRRMNTWKLMREVVTRSKKEICSALYICFALFSLMGISVYDVEMGYQREMKDETAENVANSAQNLSLLDAVTTFNQTKAEVSVDSSFKHLGDAYWFSLVSILTIGYGDIVPTYWLTKVLTCLFAYLTYCLFVAASTLVSVGMAISIETEAKVREKQKYRQLAARVIQHWFRFHLLHTKKKKFSHFKGEVFRLFLSQRTTQEHTPVKDSIRKLFGRKSLLHLTPEQIQRSESAPDDLHEDKEFLIHRRQPMQPTHMFDEHEISHEKYSLVLQFCRILLFRSTVEKFKRMRRPLQVIDAEAVVVEMEQERNQHVMALEERVSTILGSDTGKPKDRKFSCGSTIYHRLCFAEDKLEELNGKIDELHVLSLQISNLLGVPIIGEVLEEEPSSLASTTETNKTDQSCDASENPPTVRSNIVRFSDVDDFFTDHAETYHTFPRGADPRVPRRK